MTSEYGTTIFVFVIRCNPLVEESFRKIASSVENGQYFSMSRAHELPEAILSILEGVSDLIEGDRKVLTFYEANDGVFEIGKAADELNMELRQLKISLSRLIELERIPRWPKGRPLSPDKMGIEVLLGDVPDALIAGRAFNYRMRVKNPSASVLGIRVIVTLVTDEGVSEITNEQHEIGPRDDRQIELNLVPMTESKEKASLRVEVFYGSKALAQKIYTTRVY